MKMTDINLDGGKSFDWGKTSADYAKYRDIYPQEFYQRIVDRGLCINGQNILDIGTGTGVIPRNMYKFGGHWTGTDIQENQIKQAKIMSEGMDISYFVSASEDIDFPENSFDVITACQCFWYFDHKKTMPVFDKILKKDGRILVLYMAWLPYEDKIAGASEELVLKYSPEWSGAGETMHPIFIHEIYKDKFELCYHDEYKLNVHFTRETWNGRMKACRGVGASLEKDRLEQWEKEHIKLLDEIADDEFDVLHYAAIAELKRK